MDKNDITSTENSENKAIKCLCCGEMCHSKYCPNCGQKTSTKRLSFKAILDYILYGMFKMNGGFIYTTKELLIHPWVVIRDYIHGRRTIYMQPFLTLIALCLYMAIFRHILHFESEHFDITELLTELDVTTTNQLGNYYIAATNYLMNNSFLMYLLVIPPLIFSTRLVYRKENSSRFNITEYTVAGTYMLSLSVIMDIILLPTQYFLSQQTCVTLSNLIIIAYFLTILWKAFPMKWSKQLWYNIKLLLTSFIFSTIYILILIFLNSLIIGYISR